MSTSQSSQVSDTIDVAITTAQFLKNWVAGRYRNLIDWGSVLGGTRVTAEQNILDKKGRPTIKWKPVSLLLTDLTARTVTAQATTSFIQTINQDVPNGVGSPTVQLLKGPPAGKTNWRRIVVEQVQLGQQANVYLVPGSNSVISSAMFVLASPFQPFSGGIWRLPYVMFDDFGSSIWAFNDAISASVSTVRGIAYA